MAKPDWNQRMTLEEATASVTRLARFEPGVVAELPTESLLRIDVNGMLAGTVHCLPDAPAELALGWAFMHGFFGPGDAIDAVTVHAGRASVMVQTTVDIERQRLEAAGWADGRDLVDPGEPQSVAPFAIHADVLADIMRTTWRAMAQDRSRDGFVHAAAASDEDIHCVARDQTVSLAVAKIIGWRLREDRDISTPIFLVRGMVDRPMIVALGRLGASLVAATGIPTADAFREATGRGMSLVGMAGSRRPGLLVDGGHVLEEDHIDGADDDGSL